jgi:D-tyrosyl-tRNA(Tyr) deacylase
VIGLVQRVRQAKVVVSDQTVGAIDAGMLVFVCAEPADTEAQVTRFVHKLLKLRIFADEAGRMNRSLQDTGGGLLIVSQFTLAADTSSGHRPGFSAAAEPVLGQRLYESVLATARAAHPQVAQGRFGADMQVHLVNDGPVTIPLRVT